MKPNILLIVCDQMRGDCMGVAGHPDVKTPYLDSLAADGHLFPNTYSACPSCIASRAALFTGQSQRRHGRVGYCDGIPWNYKNMLPQQLSDGGYYTGCVGKLHVHPPLRRCGFDSLQLHDGYMECYRKPDIPYAHHQLAHDSYLRYIKRRAGYDADVCDTGLECNSWVARPWIYDEMLHPTNWAVSESIQFLEQRDPDRPFFLMTSFVRPHPPLDAPACYLDRYLSVPQAPPHIGSWEDMELSRARGKTVNSMYGCHDKELQRQAMAGYYAAITHMDHQIGRLLQAVEASGCMDDTVIVFLSDHGELLFDHGYFRKVLPYQGSVHIPLIIKSGKNVPQIPIANTQRLTELRDILPTLIQLAGLEIPEDVDGLSLLGEGVRDYLHGEHSGGVQSNHYIVTDTDKYIWFSQTGQEQYFNLREDPHEQCNLIEDKGCGERIAMLRKLLIGELAGRPEGYSDGQRLMVGCTPRDVL